MQESVMKQHVAEVETDKFSGYHADLWGEFRIMRMIDFVR